MRNPDLLDERLVRGLRLHLSSLKMVAVRAVTGTMISRKDVASH